MSRSHRHTAVIGMTCARSDKPFKVDEHRRERRTVRTLLAAGFCDADRRLHAKRYGNICFSPKDGKQWVDPHSKWMRK
jgi:hypothetical protein